MANLDTRVILQQLPGGRIAQPDELEHFVRRQRTAAELANMQTKSVRFQVELTGNWMTLPLTLDLRGIAGPGGAALRELENMYDCIWGTIWANGSGHGVVEYDSNGGLDLHISQHTAKIARKCNARTICSFIIIKTQKQLDSRCRVFI